MPVVCKVKAEPVEVYTSCDRVKIKTYRCGCSEDEENKSAFLNYPDKFPGQIYTSTLIGIIKK